MPHRETIEKPTERYVAFLRGVNVGKAKRIAMADLRAVVQSLGYGDVSTLLNSGNVIFSAAGLDKSAAAEGIEEAIAGELGVRCRVTLASGQELAVAVAGNPLVAVASDPARLLVAVLHPNADRARLLSLQEQDWSPDHFAFGERVAYLWCCDGILDSRLATGFGRALGDTATTRNWSTFLKLHALAGT